MRRKAFTFVLALVLVTVAIGSLALAGGGYDVSWHVIGGGGGTSRGGRYALDATIGQPVAATSGGGAYRLCVGFWCGNVPGWRLYLPDMLRGYFH